MLSTWIESIVSIFNIDQKPVLTPINCYSPSFPAFSPWNVWHPAGVYIWIDTGLSPCRHVTVDLDSIIHHPQVRINPVISILDLGMSIVKILTSSGWVVSCSCRLLDLLQFNSHVVDVSVDCDQVNIAILLRSSLLTDGISSGLSFWS